MVIFLDYKEMQVLGVGSPLCTPQVGPEERGAVSTLECYPGREVTRTPRCSGPPFSWVPTKQCLSLRHAHQPG